MQRRPRRAMRARERESSLLYNIQLDIQGLQQELYSLTQYRQLLMARALNRPDDPDGSYAHTVQEYFRVFRNGYRTSDSPPGRESGRFHLVDEFVARAIDEDVVVGGYSGLDQMMEQWRRYSLALGPITLLFLDSTVVASTERTQSHVVVTARAQYHLYITLRTLEIMFPHLLPIKEIVTKILGRRLSGIGRFDFVFDSTTNRIVRYEFDLNLMASFMELLGNPHQVAVILGNALISDESYIGDLSSFIPASQDDNAQPCDVVPIQSSPKPWQMEIRSILCQDGPEQLELAP
ncbi:hypothetical protein Poli38472_006786 [Pythium oligandrum]|uniref:Uncharacterized protein n=1 Tax=Pythium oligandrum TaxID=41045 RepID=A0A8K1FC40_PYTOL|nr:hypothetical protein Poli38472_006786 [Pythium oligandrum]|eukprot:TMW56776.1 hypothetical protein Poli38472_006786 [Pythium oligandrum]